MKCRSLLRAKDGGDVVSEPLVGGIEVLSYVPGLGLMRLREFGGDLVEVGTTATTSRVRPCRSKISSNGPRGAASS